MVGVVSVRTELLAFVNLWWHSVWGSKYDKHSYSWPDSWRMVPYMAGKMNAELNSVPESVNCQCESTSICVLNFCPYLQVGL